MSVLDKEIFKDKKFSDLLSEIYDNQKKKERQISTLIGELKPLIADIGDATLIVPLIKDYLEIGVRNDEQLIKMATIVQRLASATGNSDDSLGISEAEKEQLMNELEEIGNNLKEQDKKDKEEE
jgi:hypothetical protein|tara:strand:+ start:90 stop:461 length:372 start_codon:yes stop_codon:yes gene_type:complete